MKSIAPGGILLVMETEIKRLLLVVMKIRLNMLAPWMEPCSGISMEIQVLALHPIMIHSIGYHVIIMNQIVCLVYAGILQIIKWIVVIDAVIKLIYVDISNGKLHIFLPEFYVVFPDNFNRFPVFL